MVKPLDLIELFTLYTKLDDRARGLIKQCERLWNQGKVAEARKLFTSLEKIQAQMEAMEKQ